LLKTLSKEPEGRFQSASQLNAALEGLARTNSSTALQPTLLPPVESPPPEHPAADTRPKGFGSPVLKGVSYLPAILLILAGACLLIGLLKNNKDAYLAMAWLLGIGAFPVLFSAVRRWLQQREATLVNKAGETWLMTAAKVGNASLVRVQLNRGAEVNDKDRGGQTALMKAAENGNIAVVRLLLAAGAEVDEKDNEGQTALMKAEAGGHSEIVRLLERVPRR
jgi:hypothetical protein